MPNWCECELDVIGSVQERQRFARKAVDSEDRSVLIDFRSFVPMPNEVRESDNVREWCIENWGTKWNLVDDTTIEENSPSLTRYSFMTAWSPPIPVIKAMAKQFPTLRFELRYWEGGVGFQGEYCIQNDTVILEEHGTYVGPRGG